jgi:hypothetical protein
VEEVREGVRDLRSQGVGMGVGGIEMMFREGENGSWRGVW